jgi:hypothetical protein
VKAAVYVILERIVVGYDKQLVEILDLADLLSQIFTAFGIHVCCRLVKESDSDI